MNRTLKYALISIATLGAFTSFELVPTFVDRADKKLTRIVQQDPSGSYEKANGKDGKKYIMNILENISYELERKKVRDGEGYIHLIKRNLADPAQEFTKEYFDLVEILTRYNCEVLEECGKPYPKHELYVPVRRLTEEESNKIFPKGD